MQFAGRLRRRLALGCLKRADVMADAARRDARQFEALILAPQQKPMHGVAVCLAGIIVSDLVAEELGVGEVCVGAGLRDDRRRLARVESRGQ